MSLPDPPSFPLRAEHEAWAIEWLAQAATHVRDKLEASGAERFETLLKEVLREGMELKVVEAADKGDWLCDKALREVGAEFLDAMIQKRDLPVGGMQIVSYYQRAAGRAPLSRKAGRHSDYDYWFRNVGVCMLIELARKWLGVPPTRNPAGRRPSGCTLTSAALKRHGIRIKEGTIQKDIWFGVWGMAVRDTAGKGWDPFIREKRPGTVVVPF